MPVAALTTLGCKVNQYETEKIAEDFLRAGFTLVDFDSPADIYVINSCSVTNAADKKSRYLARRAQRSNPAAVVAMTGCHSQQVIDDGGWVEGATLLIPNDRKMDAYALVAAQLPDLDMLSSSPATLPPRGKRTRATLKIQDGCEHFCGFCQIPYTRKVLESRSFTDVVAEARDFGTSGCREVVVTGVCVGAYGPDSGSGGEVLADVLRAVAAQPGIDRVRLSSIQPIEVIDSVIDAYASTPGLCPHLHLSCQSGDDTILKAMNRPYTTAFYEELVAKLRQRIPDVAITTDLIVGYPGETEAFHQNTLAFAQRVGFQKTHVFRYSPRPRTKAADMVDDVDDATKKRRHAELQAVVDASTRSFAAKYIGRTMPVLLENSEGTAGTLSGYTTNYIRVTCTAPKALIGNVVNVSLNALTNDGIAGNIVDDLDVLMEVASPKLARQPLELPVLTSS
jgi:threonylcarbamoyladenosine tRNA methylthiotransferase MtaB